MKTPRSRQQFSTESSELAPLASAEDPNVGLMVRYTFRSFTRVLQMLVAPHGLTSAEFRVLRTLATDGALTQVQIAALAGMDRPYAALIVKQLRAKALVETRPDTIDRRRVNISLSARGLEITDDIAHRLAKVNRSAIDGVTAQEFTTFSDVINRIRTNLDQVEPERTLRGDEPAC